VVPLGIGKKNRGGVFPHEGNRGMSALKVNKKKDARGTSR